MHDQTHGSGDGPLRGERIGDVVIVRVDHLGLVRDDSREVVARTIEAHPGCDMVLSCREIRYISSSAFGVLIYAYRLLEKAGRRLVIVSDEPTVLDLLRATRLDQVLRIAPDEETAREMLAGGPASPASPGMLDQLG